MVEFQTAQNFSTNNFIYGRGNFVILDDVFNIVHCKSYLREVIAIYIIRLSCFITLMYMYTTVSMLLLRYLLR